MNDRSELRDHLSKVPAVTLAFWVAKILATTLGETGGDTFTMTLQLGYLVGSVIFLGLLAVLVFLQIRATRYNPALYWLTILASTTAGTTLADFADRSLGIGYLGGSLLLGGALIAILLAWRLVEGEVSTDKITSPRAEAFYWATITVSQTLGTALGDWVADDAGLGYLGSAGLFCVGLALVAGAYLWTRSSRALLFWAAFVLTRPLGATVGDFLDKPLDQGGLALSRPIASAVLLLLVAIAVWLTQRTVNNEAEKPQWRPSAPE